MRDIAVEVGCSYSAVVYVTRTFGVQHPRWRKAKQADNWSDIVKAALRRKYPNGRFGPLASNWRGGRRRINGANSYIAIYAPNHPNADKDGYVLEQRYVMSEHLGRPLVIGELVHHVNGNKQDNRIENLQLVASKKAHSKIHFDAVKLLQKLKEDPELRAKIAALELLE